MVGCFTCEVNRGQRLVPGGTIYEDAHWLADHGVPHLLRGYVVLKTRRHVEGIDELASVEAASLGSALGALQAAISEATGAERVYVLSFGEGVRHVHFHLLPRHAAMPAAGPDLLHDIFAGKWSCSEEDAKEAAARIRGALTTSSLASSFRGE